MPRTTGGKVALAVVVLLVLWVVFAAAGCGSSEVGSAGLAGAAVFITLVEPTA